MQPNAKLKNFNYRLLTDHAPRGISGSEKKNPVFPFPTTTPNLCQATLIVQLGHIHI